MRLISKYCLECQGRLETTISLGVLRLAIANHWCWQVSKRFTDSCHYSLIEKAVSGGLSKLRLRLQLGMIHSFSELLLVWEVA